MSGVLIAGIGNIFLGDDGFGGEVIARLARRALPLGVRARDFGICGVDLAYALADDLDLAILVDAVSRGNAPGTLYVIAPEDAAIDAERPGAWAGAHDMGPATVLAAARTLGGGCCRVLIVGCEPESFGTEDGGAGRMGLSPPVAAAADRAVDLVLTLAGSATDAAGDANVGTAGWFALGRTHAGAIAARHEPGGAGTSTTRRNGK